MSCHSQRCSAIAVVFLFATSVAAPALAMSITPESGQAYLDVEYLYFEDGFPYVGDNVTTADPTSAFDINSSTPQLHGEVGPDHVRYYGSIANYQELDTDASYRLDLSFAGGTVHWQGSHGVCFVCQGDRIALESIDAQGNVLAVIDEHITADDAYSFGFDETFFLPAGLYRVSGFFSTFDTEAASFEASLDLVPEPATGMLVASGLIACAVSGLRRRSSPA